MNEDIEQRLRQLSQQTLPAEWRNQIISSAVRSQKEALDRTSLSYLRIMQTFLFENRRFACALGCLWIAIIFFNLNTPEGTWVQEHGTTQIVDREPDLFLAEMPRDFSTVLIENNKDGIPNN